MLITTPWKRTGEWRWSPTHSKPWQHVWRWDFNFTPGRFNDRKRAAGPIWITGWVEPIAGLGALKMRKILANTGNRTPAVQDAVDKFTVWSMAIHTANVIVNRIYRTTNTIWSKMHSRYIYCPLLEALKRVDSAATASGNVLLGTERFGGKMV